VNPKEALMDNSRAVLASLIGAMVGGVVAYLFFTDSGKRLRHQVEPAIDDLARELASFRSTIKKATGVASDSWQMFNDAIGESSPSHATPSVRYSNPRQTSPF
jgi:gas vesicle protein